MPNESNGPFASFRRGFSNRCPRCGKGRILSGYLTPAASCGACDLGFDPYRADDAPAYFTLLLVGHIVVPGMLLLEKFAAPSTLLHLAIWLPATVVLTLALLPRIKASVVAVQWALKVRG
jgi:uncharacterized protein (DUF983 family)